MARRFGHVREFIAELRRQAERDSDNFLPIFGGDENGGTGVGKSTLALQLGVALNPRLTVDDVHFGIPNFLMNAPPPEGEETYELRRARHGNGHRVVIGDELELSKRRAVFGASLDLQEFFKDCRGLNLDMIVCFPDEDQFDRIYAARARYKIVVPYRGRFKVYEREGRKRFKRGGIVEPYHVWVEVGDFTFEENSTGNPLWAAYKEKKALHMRSLGGEYREAARSAGSGVDLADATSHFRGILRMHEEQGGARAAIHEAP